MKSNEHQQAFNLFFQTDFTRKQIADMLNIDRKTLFTWIKEGSWMRSKNAARQTPTLLVEQYYNQLCELNLKIAERDDMPYPTKDEAEIIRKLTAVISQYNKKKASIGETIEVLADFHEYLDRNYNGEGKYIMSFSDKYVQHRYATNNKFDFGKQYYENILRDREYEQYLKEQAELKNDDPDDTPNVMVSPVEPPPTDPSNNDTGEGGIPIKPTSPPIAPAPHSRSASRCEAKPPVKNYYMGNPIPIPESRKNFYTNIEAPSTKETAKETNKPTSNVTLSPVEAQALNADIIAPPSDDPGAKTGNFPLLENALKPSPTLTNNKTTPTENGEFLNFDGEENPASTPSLSANPAEANHTKHPDNKPTHPNANNILKPGHVHSRPVQMGRPPEGFWNDRTQRRDRYRW